MGREEGPKKKGEEKEEDQEEAFDSPTRSFWACSLKHNRPKLHCTFITLRIRDAVRHRDCSRGPFPAHARWRTLPGQAKSSQAWMLSNS